MKRNRFYKTSPHGYLGSLVVFHAIDGKGYTSDLSKAHVYTLKEAQEEVDNGWLRSRSGYSDGALDEIFLSADHVDSMSVERVDCQFIKDEMMVDFDHVKEDTAYVLYRKQKWDGNDLGFATDLGYSFNYEKAKTFFGFELKEMDNNSLLSDAGEWVIIAKVSADSVKRREFEFKNINRRKMISCAGLVGIRKPRAGKSSGKNRWNCPSCGKINCQYNPYDFDGCSDVMCDEWRSRF